ncbi:plasma-membrane proton-efflux P-type ATPase [Acidiplasma aeolicum]|jgi:H+-transporting ATPase|uniref:plasma-membrane proton-efflux P-type ATPase n=1 Tax=Acidiplasma aeolicum TaxID=507754 RepID=UPI00371BC72C
MAADNSQILTSKDLQNLSIDDILNKLNTSNNGLSSSDAEKRISLYGKNEIPEKEENPILKFLGYFINPLAIAIEVAAILSIILGRLPDFYLIIALLFTNVVIEFWQERSAGNAVKALMKKLAINTRVLRDNHWEVIPASELVPGDIIHLSIGNIVPADAKLINGSYLNVDQSSLTGESLPVSKSVGDIIYSSSLVKQGEMDAVVIGTGKGTLFGKTTTLTSEAVKTSNMQKITDKVLYFLVAIAIALDIIIFIDGIILHTNLLDDLLFALILLVASIPIAMPVVLTMTMALGTVELSKKNAIVTRFASVEELSTMDILCSDKTGTLTQNIITAGNPVPYNNYTSDDVLLYAVLSSNRENGDAIDQAIIEKAELLGITKALTNFTQQSFVPFDPSKKRTESTVLNHNNNSILYIMKGEPNTIISLINNVPENLLSEVNNLASGGYRVIAVAISNDKKTYNFVGLIPLFDPLRPDTKEMINTAENMGIKIKMVTGDNIAIAREIGRQISLTGSAINSSDLPKINSSEIEKIDIFAQVFPEQKYDIVKLLKSAKHTVGMTGDGVNDAPALKEANVGIAVYGATDVAKNAADLVLSAPGLSVIVDAVKLGRSVFQKMLSYVLYRITETIRILVFVTAAILIFGFYPITAFMLVILALLNDIPIIAVSTDNVTPSQSPEKWNMKYITGLSSTLGFMGSGETLLLLYIGYSVFHLPLAAVYTIVFLKLIASGHFTMFVTRNRKVFWHNPPSLILFTALLSTIILGYFLSTFGLGMASVGPVISILVVLYAFFWFMVEDGLRLAYDRLFILYKK